MIELLLDKITCVIYNEIKSKTFIIEATRPDNFFMRVLIIFQRFSLSEF